MGKVPLIKELQKNGVFVIGTDVNPLSSGLYISDKKYVVPKGDDPNFLQSMINICKIEKQGKFKFSNSIREKSLGNLFYTLKNNINKNINVYDHSSPTKIIFDKSKKHRSL